MLSPPILDPVGRPLLPTRHEVRSARTRLEWPTGFLEKRAGLSAGRLEPFERGDAFLDLEEMLHLDSAFREARVQFIDRAVKFLAVGEGLVDVGDPVAMIARSYIRFHHIHAHQRNAETFQRQTRRCQRKAQQGEATCTMT